MIGYFFRMLRVVLREQLHARTDDRFTCTDHRVSLQQVDFNRHMNQAAYPNVCETARVSWLFRTGALERWRAAKANPIVASQTITYRRELAPLQRYRIDVRATGMDGRLLVVEHTFLVGDRVHARNEVRLIFVGPGGVLSAEDTAALCEPVITGPLPIHDWTLAS